VNSAKGLLLQQVGKVGKSRRQQAVVADFVQEHVDSSLTCGPKKWFHQLQPEGSKAMADASPNLNETIDSPDPEWRRNFLKWHKVEERWRANIRITPAKRKTSRIGPGDQFTPGSPS
jgi:hypothetical protein